MCHHRSLAYQLPVEQIELLVGEAVAADYIPAYICVETIPADTADHPVSLGPTKT